jgi:hypothetical protein
MKVPYQALRNDAGSATHDCNVGVVDAFGSGGNAGYFRDGFISLRVSLPKYQITPVALSHLGAFCAGCVARYVYLCGMFRSFRVFDALDFTTISGNDVLF